MESSLRIGDVAKRTGLTVRALHHYDEIGLLRPTGRTEAGHRRYSHADLYRLQQIQALRLMGASLDDARRWLDASALDAQQIVTLTKKKLEAQVVRWRELVGEFTDGDREIGAAVRTMYHEAGGEIASKHPNTPDPAMLEYMSRVFATLEGGGPG